MDFTGTSCYMEAFKWFRPTCTCVDLAGSSMGEVHVSFHAVGRQLRPGVPGGGEAGMGENTHGVIGTHLRCYRLVAAS